MEISGTGTLELEQPCDLVIGDTKLMYRRQFETYAPNMTKVTKTLMFPSQPKWSKNWLAQRTNFGTMPGKIKVSSHDDMTKAIVSAIKETEGLEKQWTTENHIKENQRRFEVLDTHSYGR